MAILADDSVVLPGYVRGIQTHAGAKCIAILRLPCGGVVDEVGGKQLLQAGPGLSCRQILSDEGASTILRILLGRLIVVR